MDERRNNQNLPWDDSIYGTGRTRPRKSHGGIIALLLILVIFLSGVVAFLSIMNVRLLNQLGDQPEDGQNHPMFFSQQNETAPSDDPQVPPTKSTEPEEAPGSIELSPTPQSQENIPQEGGLSLQEIYVRNLPSVVSITSQTPGGVSTGTGVILTEDGYIVTNCHVIRDGQIFTVRLHDGTTLDALLVGLDEVSDLAVLQVEAENLTPAQLGDSDSLRVGDAVVAIGDPLGQQFSGSMTDGIVSAINRDVSVNGRIMTLIQTNAAMNSGNSGGPLINCYGQVIGINTLKIGTFSDSAGVEGIAFAIPSTTVQDIASQLIRQGYVSGRPTLGISGEEVPVFYQYYSRMPAGLYINEVTPGSDAYTKGVDIGDILLTINGQRISDMNSLNAVLYTLEVGDQVEAVIYRGGKQYLLELTVTEATD